MFLTEEEVFQAAYITGKGWEYDRYEKKWSKKGFLRDTWTLHNCGCCRKEGKTEHFHLSDAFDAQRYKEDEDARPVDKGTEEGSVVAEKAG